ncbi:hypothetical protein SEVIR_7G108600v4 [Setaria viridis]|uniref:Uncharacterized protein n=1 Tax=Setaria viridis TaxID=4556 RepID=A0A4U6U2V5_SETVI|nr:DELLA protein DWARF8-like [Setaria viridis]TKW04427.1 hypothetical protein SEVIR_7G108600v2 [Setaria viridis]
MNLTLSLAINGGTSTGTGKKRKVRDSVVIDDVGDGGDRSRVLRILQARERMMARLEVDDPRVAHDDGGGSGGLRLMHLLLTSVAAGEAGDVHAATAALHEVYRRASFGGGDPAPRVAAYFADALASRLLRSPVAASPPTRGEQFLAYTMFYQASPLYQFAHFTANQAIVEAFERGGRRRLHVVDFDVSYGFQWPSLIQSLSDAAVTSTSGGSHDGDGDGDSKEPVSLRITGLGTSADELRQTEARLTRFASGCPNVRFEFEGVVNGPSSGLHERIIKNDGDDATVVVNLAFPAARTSPTSTREACGDLARVRSLNPSLVFLVERGGSSSNGTPRGRSSLLPPFTASLRYFAAVFDSLHECLPADSAERLAIERNYLGVEISNAVSSLDRSHGGGGDHTAEPSSSACWKDMMESAGFQGVALSSRTVSQAKLLLKMKSGCAGSGGGFRVIEGDGGRAMSLGWRDSALITTTAWRRRRRSIDKTSS